MIIGTGYVSISFHLTLKLTLTPTLTLTLGLTLVAPLTKIPEESSYITALFGSLASRSSRSRQS